MPYGHGRRLVSGRFNWCGVGGVLKPATSWPARVALWCSSVGSSRFFRAVIFALAGTSKMPYRRFLGRNAVGGTVWEWVRGAGLSGRRLRSAGRQASRYGTAIAVAAIVLIGIVMWGIRRYRRSTLTSRKSPLHLPHGTRPSQLRSTWVEDSLSLVLAHRIWRSVSG